MTVEYNLTSSANSFRLKLGGNKLHISFTNMTYNTGPRTLYCGTPLTMSQ